MERRCSKCLQFKPLTEFHNDKKGKDGKSYRCKACARAHVGQYYVANLEKCQTANRAYHHANKEKANARSREYAATHKEDNRKRQQEWYYSHKDTQKERDHAKYLRRKEAVLKRGKEYVKENQASCNAKKAAYYRANKTKVRASIQAWYNNKRKTDPAFRVLCALRRRLTHAIMGNNKSARTIELLGCEIPILMAHLEARFTEGMTWQNYGAWQIDHVRPCALFPLHTEEGQRACFHYTNLQPLWKEHNQSKGKRFNSASASVANPVPTPPQSGSFPAQPRPLLPV